MITNYLLSAEDNSNYLLSTEENSHYLLSTEDNSHYLVFTEDNSDYLMFTQLNKLAWSWMGKGTENLLAPKIAQKLLPKFYFSNVNVFMIF